MIVNSHDMFLFVFSVLPNWKLEKCVCKCRISQLHEQPHSFALGFLCPNLWYWRVSFIFPILSKRLSAQHSLLFNFYGSLSLLWQFLLRCDRYLPDIPAALAVRLLATFPNKFLSCPFTNFQRMSCFWWCELISPPVVDGRHGVPQKI